MREQSIHQNNLNTDFSDDVDLLKYNESQPGISALPEITGSQKRQNEDDLDDYNS